MAFKLAEAFIQFSARTEQATAGMEAIEEKARETAATVEASSTAMSTATAALGGALIGVGVLAATRFAGGLTEAMSKGANFSDSMDNAANHMLGFESRLDRIAEGMKGLKERTEAENKSLEHFNELLGKATGTEAPPRFAALGATQSRELEKALAMKQSELEKAQQASREGELAIKAAEEKFAQQPFANRGMELRRLHERWDPVIQETERLGRQFNDANARAESANRGAAVQKFIGASALDLAHDARDIGRGVPGFLGNAAAGMGAIFKAAEKSAKQIEAFQNREQAGGERFTGVEAIKERFKKQIEDVEKDIENQREIEKKSPRRADRDAADAKITKDKELIDKLREQEATEKRALTVAVDSKELLKEQLETFKKFATKTFGWGP